MTSQLWFTARGTGLAALVLLTVATALGALVSRHGKPGRRYLVQYLHRVSAGLGLGALAIHLATILLDSYAHVSLAGAAIPFTAGFRPTWVGLGTIGAYVFLGVSALGMARGRMARSPRGARTWRGLHALSSLGWLAAMAHGFFSGTDSSVGWVRMLYVGCAAAVAGSLAIRLSEGRTTAAPTDRFAGRPAPAQLIQGASR